MTLYVTVHEEFFHGGSNETIALEATEEASTRGDYNLTLTRQRALEIGAALIRAAGHEVDYWEIF